MHPPLRLRSRNWILVTVLFASAPALAQDYTAIRIEAENFSSRNSDWQITSPTAMPADPVDPFHQNASGDTYMELLPDTRVTDLDEILQGQNFWGGPGDGPALHYNVDVPQAGRYIVYAKAYSTGTEDNGIHVGINSTTPQSGHRLQWCEGKNNWTWSSAQRTDDAHCGVPKTIYLDIASAGQNTITFWAREDGFELDQFILLKEDHDGSLDCYPTATDSIRCDDANGAPVSDVYLPVTVLDQGNQIDTPEDSDGLVDLSVTLAAGSEFVSPGQIIDYTVAIQNNDVAETATGVTATVTLGDGLQFNASDTCVASGSSVSCTAAEILAGQSASRTFSAVATTTGSLFINASIDADQSDDRISNNSAWQSVVSNQPEHPINGTLELAANTNVVIAGSQVEIRADIANLGSQSIDDAQLSVTLPAGASLQSAAGACSASPCLIDVPAIAVAQRASVTFTATSGDGDLTLPVELLLSGDGQTADNSASVTIAASDNAARMISQNGLVSVEAEQFSSSSPSSLSVAQGHGTPAWNLASIDAVSYVVLLPDSRSSDAAPAVSGASNFSAGTGPTLDYPVFFEQPGRYFVHVRMRANNSQDAALHVGLNNDWPASGAINLCQPNGDWQWATIAADCTAAEAGYLDVAIPGEHTLQISAATDGSQVDKILLTTDQSYIASDAGPAATIFTIGDADVAITAELSASSVGLEEQSELTIRLSNPGANPASGISVSIDGIDPALAQSIAGFDFCDPSDTGAECFLASLAAGAEHSATLALSSDVETTMQIDIGVSTLSNDTGSGDNAASVALKIAAGGGGGGIGAAWLLLLALGWRRRAAS